MIGIDVVQLDRVPLKESFITYILTPQEEKEYRTKTTDHAKKEYLAGRFAVKEAIFKASQDKEYLSYSCLAQENGKPYILDHPEIDVSISHDGGIAIAMVQIEQK